MYGRLRIILFLIFSGICIYHVEAGNHVPEKLLSELKYIDSLDQQVKSWFNNPEYSFRKIFDLLNSTKKDILKTYGKKSLSYAYILHKQGVAYVNLYEDTDESNKIAIRYYQKALQIRMLLGSDSDSIISPLLVLGYSNISNCYFRLQNPHEALYYTLKGLEIIEKYPYKELILNSQMKLYTLAARTYYDIGDYDNAIKYYSAIIHYQYKSNNDEIIEILKVWKTKALIELGGMQAWPLYATEEAIENLTEGIGELQIQQSKKNNIYLAEAYYQLGSAYQSIGNYKDAISYYQKSISISEEYELQDYIINNYISLSILYTEQHKLDKASKYLQSAEKIIENNQIFDSQIWLCIYDAIADIAYSREQFFKSLEFDNKAIQFMVPGFHPETFFDNPNFSNMAVADKPWLLGSLASKAQTLMKLYQTTQDREYLQYAYNTFLLADNLLDNIRSSYVADASKMDLVKQAKPVYEQAIETCWILQENFQCDSCLEQAFHYSEKSRSIILLDAVRKTAARTKLPTHLVEEEKELNLKVNYYEKQVAIQAQEENTQGSINFYDSLLAYRRKHNAITATVKEQYPEYHNAIFGQSAVGTEQVMGFIQPDQTFIEYFVGDSNLYAFVISKNKTSFVKLGATDSLGIWLNEFNQNILNKDQQFIIPGYKLYSYLIASIAKNQPLTEKLVIVPDNILSNISFDALVTKQPKNNRVYLPDYKDFLLYSYQVSHVFSASAVFEAYIKQEKKLKTYLGIAPLFEKGISVDDSYFDQLDENINEIKLARKLFISGHLLINNIDRTTLINEVGKYAIIHFATHAQANVENGDLSYILFGTKEDQRLYAKDLYALDLNSELVVLSACQTGKGSLERGEGTISLARAFIYAGSSSVLTSLWNVREKSNFDIVINFYEELKSGKSKDASLRDAKIAYLASITRENQEQAHPFYWSPLIAVGDMSPLHYKNNRLKITIAGLIIMVMSAFFIYFKRKDKLT